VELTESSSSSRRAEKLYGQALAGIPKGLPTRLELEADGQGIAGGKIAALGLHRIGLADGGAGKCAE
jgi:hypothetical protein